MTLPRPEQLAPSVDPLVRAYIDAVMARQADASDLRLASVNAANERRWQELTVHLHTIQAQLNDLSAALRLAPNSRRRLMELVDQLNIVAAEESVK